MTSDVEEDEAAAPVVAGPAGMDVVVGDVGEPGGEAARLRFFRARLCPTQARTAFRSSSGMMAMAGMPSEGCCSA